MNNNCVAQGQHARRTTTLAEPSVASRAMGIGSILSTVYHDYYENQIYTWNNQFYCLFNFFIYFIIILIEK